MKKPSELLSEARLDRAAKIEQAFEAFCKNELLHLNDIIEKKEKDLGESIKRMDSYTIENLREMFEKRDICMAGTHKEKWMRKLFPEEYDASS